LAAGWSSINFITPNRGFDGFVGIKYDRGFGINASAVGDISFGFDAVINEAFAIAVGVVGR